MAHHQHQFHQNGHRAIKSSNRPLCLVRLLAACNTSLYCNNHIIREGLYSRVSATLKGDTRPATGLQTRRGQKISQREDQKNRRKAGAAGTKERKPDEKGTCPMDSSVDAWKLPAGQCWTIETTNAAVSTRWPRWINVHITGWTKLD